MTDKRFRWLLVAASLTCIIVAFIWKYPDAVKANAEKDAKLGEYVYIDPRSKVHASRKCPKLNYKGWKSKRIKIDDMFNFFKSTPLEEISFCPHCVSDKDYESIISTFAAQIEDTSDNIYNAAPLYD